MEQAELFNLRDVPPVGVTERSDETAIHEELRAFREFGKATVVTSIEDGGEAVPVYINEFWTAKQRAAHSLHEVSYRACFKPQLPQFFIQRFS